MVTRRRISDGRWRRARRGAFTLAEMVAAASLLAMLTVVVGRLLMTARDASEASAGRLRALREVENLLERAAAAARRSDDWRTEVENFPLSASAVGLDDPQHDVEVGPADEFGMSPVTVSLSWRTRADVRARPVTLTAWLPSRPGPLEDETAAEGPASASPGVELERSDPEEGGP